VVSREGRSFAVRSAALAGLLAALLASSSCSIKKIAINSIANTLAESGSTFASDDDPELIRDAVPFSLKLMESVLADTPKHRGLLLAACSGFTQYAFAFVQVDAELVEHEDFAKSEELKGRARRLYLRAQKYGMRDLEVAYPGLGARLMKDPEAAVQDVKKKEDVPALYWTGAAWGGAVSLGLDRPDLIADLPAARALLGRALALDESWGQGAIHEAFISLEALPAAMGGSPARARQHFERAVALSKGLSAGPYVDLATTIAVADQDKAEFETLLKQALAVDPDKEPGLRLANLIAQKRARFLLDNADLYIVSH
jgi:predicted anti-sigma-YlaC factor YlaD